MEFIHNPLSWTHPIAIVVYVYSVLCLLLAGGVLWARYTILHPERDRLLRELPAIESQITMGQKQLKEANRQVDKGIEQFQRLLHIVDALFLPLLETRIAGLLLQLLERRFGKEPGWAKFVIEKGTETVFNQLEEYVIIKKETQEEAIHG